MIVANLLDESNEMVYVERACSGCNERFSTDALYQFIRPPEVKGGLPTFLYYCTECYKKNVTDVYGEDETLRIDIKI
jgi:hypothetical protein